jgi:hypothetical protein
MPRRLFALGTLATYALTTTLAAQGGAAAPPKPTPQSKPAPAAASKPAPAPATNDVSVTVTYTGKGAVDAKHGILVFLFAEPPGPGAQPITGPQTAIKNGATVTFKNVTTSPVYVAAVYNQNADYNGLGGPPPAGTPMGIVQKDAKSPPTPVTPGPKTAVKLSFSDATRFGG